jgi:hypothetical protein
MDARTATSKAETTFHTGDVAPDENAHRGQLADSEWRGDDKEQFQRSGEATVYQFYAAPHESAFGTKRTSQHAQPMSAFGGKADIDLTRNVRF